MPVRVLILIVQLAGKKSTAVLRGTSYFINITNNKKTHRDEILFAAVNYVLSYIEQRKDEIK
jgi:hypothetical protein